VRIDYTFHNACIALSLFPFFAMMKYMQNRNVITLVPENIPTRNEEQEARAARAKRADALIQQRQSQIDVYRSVTFPEGHVLGNERHIPLHPNEILLAPGHIDTLFTPLKLLEPRDLYKISQNTLREGLQKGYEARFHILDRLRSALSVLPSKDTEVITHKPDDTVFAKIDVQEILRRKAMDFEDTQTVFMNMMKQEAGNTSLRLFLQITLKEYEVMKKKGATAHDVEQLKAEVEVKVRRIIMQQQSLYQLLKNIEQDRPELTRIYSSNGTETFYQQIERLVRSELGAHPDQISIDDTVRQFMRIAFQNE
jgi:hypothetical protein